MRYCTVYFERRSAQEVFPRTNAPPLLSQNENGAISSASYLRIVFALCGGKVKHLRPIAEASSIDASQAHFGFLAGQAQLLDDPTPGSSAEEVEHVGCRDDAVEDDVPYPSPSSCGLSDQHSLFFL